MNSSVLEQDLGRRSKFDELFEVRGRLASRPFAGPMTVLENTSTGERVWARERKCIDKKDALRALDICRTRQARQTPSQISLLDFSCKREFSLSGRVFIVRQFWESSSEDLKRESALRAGEVPQRFFSRAQLRTILARVAAANRSGSHGDLSPEKLGFSGSVVSVKLMDFSETVDSLRRRLLIQQANFDSPRDIYMSPKLFEALRESRAPDCLDLSKEDAFALGLIILELGNLSSVQDIYDVPAKKINVEKLREQLNKFAFRYNDPQEPQLFEAVVNLLILDEEERMSMEELYLFFAGEKDTSVLDRFSLRESLASRASLRPLVTPPRGTSASSYIGPRRSSQPLGHAPLPGSDRRSSMTPVQSFSMMEYTPEPSGEYSEEREVGAAPPRSNRYRPPQSRDCRPKNFDERSSISTALTFRSCEPTARQQPAVGRDWLDGSTISFAAPQKAPNLMAEALLEQKLLNFFNEN